jgi:hypothetical protein
MTSSSVDLSFDDFVKKLKHLKTAYVTFNHKLFLDYTDILMQCHHDHLEHYIIEMFKKVYYILQLAENLKQCSLFHLISDEMVEKLQMDESKPLLNESIYEMKRKFTQLGAIMYKRSDVCYIKSEFSISTPRILITLKKKTHNYHVVMDTNNMESKFRFKHDPSMSAEIENMIITIPQTADVGYSHDKWFATRAVQEHNEHTFMSNKEEASKILDVDLSGITFRKSAAEQELDIHSDDIRHFCDANNLGSRKAAYIGSKKPRHVPYVASAFESPQLEILPPAIITESGSCCLSFLQLSSSSEVLLSPVVNSLNTTMESQWSEALSSMSADDEFTSSNNNDNSSKSLNTPPPQMISSDVMSINTNPTSASVIFSTNQSLIPTVTFEASDDSTSKPILSCVNTESSDDDEKQIIHRYELDKQRRHIQYTEKRKRFDGS